jgi:hypothetical protein
MEAFRAAAADDVVLSTALVRALNMVDAPSRLRAPDLQERVARTLARSGNTKAGQVWLPATPSADSLLDAWKRPTAARVRGPKIPSTPSGLKPRAVSRYCCPQVNRPYVPSGRS